MSHFERKQDQESGFFSSRSTPTPRNSTLRERTNCFVSRQQKKRLPEIIHFLPSSSQPPSNLLMTAWNKKMNEHSGTERTTEVETAPRKKS